MKAVIQTGEILPWAEPLGLPWPLLPVGNRPWIEFWIEWCVGHGIRDLRIVLGEGAYEIEQYLGDGDRWGLAIAYSFLRNPADPDAFLRREPAAWQGGLFYLRRPCFPRRTTAPGPAGTPPAFSAWRGNELLCVCDSGDDALQAITSFRRLAAPPPPAAEIQPGPIDSLAAYYALNMDLVHGGIAHYLTPGYAHRDGAYLGFNVIYPPSTALNPPLIVGNDVRIHGLASIGPGAVLGSRIIVDSQAQVRNSLVLDGTYIGRGVEIAGRIVAGRRLIDPQDGTVLELEDLHLLAPLDRTARQRERLRNLAHRGLAAALLILLFVPWLAGVLSGLAAGSRFRRERFAGRGGRPVALPVWHTRSGAPGLLHRLGLDVWPWLARVVTGQLWLVGQLPCRSGEAAETAAWPAYLPGVYGLADLRDRREDLLQRRLEACYYARRPRTSGDLGLLLRAFAGRWSGRTLPLVATEPSP